MSYSRHTALLDAYYDTIDIEWKSLRERSYDILKKEDQLSEELQKRSQVRFGLFLFQLIY